jgi:RNA polymerase sigma factor for flagellar operon FliA
MSPATDSELSTKRRIHVPDDPTEAINELWAEYKASGERGARERLILHYSPLVKFVAGRVAAGLPQSIEQADLVSYGIFGLIDAIDKFDPGRGFKFETYAISRIKGAIIDELRSIDWVPRSVRAKARAIERAYSKLENELRRSPEESEVATELEWTPGELTQTLSQISFTGLVALDDLLAASSGERSGSATVSDTITDGKHDPVEAYEVDEMKHLLADAINRMPDRERLVLTLYYYEGLTLAEIGDLLGVTESRVCQIHTKSILQLRGRLSEPEREAGPVRY